MVLDPMLTYPVTLSELSISFGSPVVSLKGINPILRNREEYGLFFPKKEMSSKLNIQTPKEDN